MCGRIGHDELGTLQAGGVEGLGRRDDCDRVVVGALDREVGDVLRTRQHQRRMDLVADDPGPVAQDDVTDPLELGTREHVAPGIVRLREDQCLGTLGEQPVEPVEVYLGASCRGRHLQLVLSATGDGCETVVGVVAGRREDHATRSAEDVDRDAYASRHVDDRVDRLRLRRPPEVPPRPAGVGLRERGIPAVERISGDAVRQHPLDRAEHQGVDGVVHLGHPRRDHALGHAPLQGKRETRLGVGEVDDRTSVLHHRGLRPARATRRLPRPARSPRPAVRRCPGVRRGSGTRPRPSRRRRRRRSS